MNIDKLEFFELCSKFDWLYSYSDDNRVYSSGKAQERKLESMIQQNPELLQIYKDFRAYAFSGEHWKTEKAKKPQLSDYE